MFLMSLSVRSSIARDNFVDQVDLDENFIEEELGTYEPVCRYRT